MTPPPSTPDPQAKQARPRWHAHPALPGLAATGAVAVLALLIGSWNAALSATLVAILIGVVARNALPIPAPLEPGLSFASKQFLRWGVALLGLQISLSTVFALGPGVLLAVAGAVGITFLATLALGKALRVDADLTVLIAAGFSICGAAAVAAVQDSVQATKEKLSAAIALVVFYGTLMIPLTISLSAVLGFGAGDTGTLIGGSTHEVGQVVAAAGIAGGSGLLAIAVPVKLARVALLAPMTALVSITRTTDRESSNPKRPPLLPGFVVVFLALMIAASTGWLPQPALDVAKSCQQFLLTAAMFALGMGVDFRALRKLGPRPLLLGLLSTAVITLVVLAFIWLGLGAAS